MTTAATIAARLILDKSDYDKGISTAGKQADNFVTKMKDVGSRLSNIGNRMTLGLTLPILAAGTAMVDAASDYEESLNKIRVVFKENSSVIEEWSRNAARNLGISQQAALEAAGTYGNLFLALGVGEEVSTEMSMSLVQLASDLASFNNANPEEVLTALRSGLSGEIEPLKKFGVAMTEALMKSKAMELGLGDNIQALTEAEKIQVRYALIMEQTALAQGDFARTSDGMANSSRILKAELRDAAAVLGKNLLPIALSVVRGLNSMLETFQKMPPFVQKAFLVFLAFLAILGPVLSIIGTILSVLASLSTLGVSLATVGTVLTTIGTILTGTLIPAVLAFIAAFWPILLIVATIYLVYLAFKNNFGGITTTVLQLGAIIKHVFGGIKKAFMDLIDSIFNVKSEIVTLYEDGSGALLELAKAFGFPAKATQELLSKLWLFMQRVKSADWKGLGRMIAWGLANGMLMGIPALVVAATQAGLAALAAIKKSLGIKSPSTEAMKLGVFTAQGYAMGLEATMNKLTVPTSMPINAITGGDSKVIHYEDNSRYNHGMSASDRAAVRHDKEQTFEFVLGL